MTSVRDIIWHRNRADNAIHDAIHLKIWMPFWVLTHGAMYYDIFKDSFDEM